MARRATMRTTQPRRFDVAAGWLDIDFPCMMPGQRHSGQCRRRSAIRPRSAARAARSFSAGRLPHGCFGDETALPSIARRIEELPAGTPVISIVAVPTDADRQEIGTAADHRAIWVSRSDPTDPAPLLAALADVPLRPAQVVWIAAEVGVARALREAVLARRWRRTGCGRAATGWPVRPMLGEGPLITAPPAGEETSEGYPPRVTAVAGDQSEGLSAAGQFCGRRRSWIPRRRRRPHCRGSWSQWPHDITPPLAVHSAINSMSCPAWLGQPRREHREK